MKKFPLSYGVVAGLLILCVISTAMTIDKIWQLPISQLFTPAFDLSLPDMARQMQILPTMTVAVLAGGLLGLASTLLQQIVKNSLASDTTLAVGSGANMALLIGTLFLPQMGLLGVWGLQLGSFWLCFIGAMGAMALVFFMAKGKDSTSLILSGLIVNILLSAISSLMFVFYADISYGVMAWGAGFVRQTGYFGVQLLIGVAVFAVITIGLLYKPLIVVSLDDAYAKSLGINIKRLSLLVLGLCGLVVSAVVSQVGILSFVGLGASSLVNALGIKKIWHRLAIAFGLGAMLLLLAQNVAVLIQSAYNLLIAEGVLSGVFGAVLIIWLIIQSNKHSLDTPPKAMPALPYRPRVWGIVGAVFVAMVALMLTFSPYARSLNMPMFMSDWQFIGEFRLPRTLFAIATGILLATAGCLLQALTKNPMASPEVLGVSSASALGVIAMFVFASKLGLPTHLGVLILGGAFGAVAVCLLLFVLAKRLKPANLLLIGIAISALTSSFLSIVKLSGDMRLQAMLSWLSGTTYYANTTSSYYLFGVSLVLLGASVAIYKPLQLISLGDGIAQSLGVNLAKYRLLTLMLVAVMSAIATLSVGTLSFVGLMIPHLAHRLGATRLVAKIPLSALLGAMMMLLADYIGRYAIFPYEISMGVIAGVVGGAYFIYLMGRKV